MSTVEIGKKVFEAKKNQEKKNEKTKKEVNKTNSRDKKRRK